MCGLRICAAIEWKQTKTILSYYLPCPNRESALWDNKMQIMEWRKESPQTTQSFSNNSSIVCQEIQQGLGGNCKHQASLHNTRWFIGRPRAAIAKSYPNAHSRRRTHSNSRERSHCWPGAHPWRGIRFTVRFLPQIGHRSTCPPALRGIDFSTSSVFALGRFFGGRKTRATEPIEVAQKRLKPTNPERRPPVLSTAFYNKMHITQKAARWTSHTIAAKWNAVRTPRLKYTHWLCAIIINAESVSDQKDGLFIPFIPFLLVIMLLSSTQCGMSATQCAFCFTFFNCACIYIVPQREVLSSKEAGPNFDVVIASSVARLYKNTRERLRDAVRGSSFQQRRLRFMEMQFASFNAQETGARAE